MGSSESNGYDDSNQYQQHMILWSTEPKVSLNYHHLPFLSDALGLAYLMYTTARDHK